MYSDLTAKTAIKIVGTTGADHSQINAFSYLEGGACGKSCTQVHD